MLSLYKKDGRKEKSNYRPVSILSNVSSVYEKCLYDQIHGSFENKFSIYKNADFVGASIPKMHSFLW